MDTPATNPRLHPSKLHLSKSALRELKQRLPKQRFHSPPSKADKHHIAEESQLKQFARHGGPDLSDIRSYPHPALWNILEMNPSLPPSRKRKLVSWSGIPRSSTYKSVRTSAYDPIFEQALIEAGAYPVLYDYGDDMQRRPGNWNEIVTRMATRRRSLSPSRFSEKDHTDFHRKNLKALGEKKITTSVFPKIRGEADIPYEEDIPFVNLKPFRPDIVAAKPDFYDGAQPERLDLQVRNQLGRYIIPSAHGDAPILPNFFAEPKARGASEAVASRQALYNGVLGARGMHILQHSHSELGHDNNAYTITSTYCSGLLQLYTVHPTASPREDRVTDYHMNMLGAWALIASPEEFEKGVAAFRNLRDWAKEKRQEFIDSANARQKEAGGKDRLRSPSSKHSSDGSYSL